MLYWNDVSLENNKIANEILKVLKLYFNEEYFNEDEFNEDKELFIYEDVKSFMMYFSRVELKEFFEEMEFCNIDLLYNDEDLEMGIIRLVTQYLDYKNDKI